MSEGLREALEKLAVGWRYTGDDLKPWQEGGGPDPHESALDFASHQIADLLAANPAEPTPDRQPSDAAVEAARSAREEVVRSIDRASDGTDWPDPMRAALEAAYRVDASRPLIDREALEVALKVCGIGSYRTIVANAVMELARPMPTQAELTDWLRDIFVTDADPEGTSWGTAAELLLALLNGAES